MAILGMLSHYRSGESQLRELLRLAPPTGVSQTKADFGFSWGGGAGGERGDVRGRVGYNLHDHMIHRFHYKGDLK